MKYATNRENYLLNNYVNTKYITNQAGIIFSKYYLY